MDLSIWSRNLAYDQLNNILHSMSCVNDVAERAVKDVVDYVNYSRDADRFNDVVLVVNSHQGLVDFQNLTKEECANLT